MIIRYLLHRLTTEHKLNEEEQYQLNFTIDWYYSSNPINFPATLLFGNDDDGSGGDYDNNNNKDNNDVEMKGKKKKKKEKKKNKTQKNFSIDSSTITCSPRDK